MTEQPSARLRGAIKPRDAWWAHRIVGPLANHVVGWVAPYPVITPNRVTVASLAVGIAAAVLFADGRWSALALGGFLLQVSFVLDCVDGQLARFRGSSSLFGSILDRLCDRMKLFAVVFGIAFGAYRVSGDTTPLLLGFAYFFCEYMVELYVTSYRRFDLGALAAPGEASPAVAAALFPFRALDLPIIQLSFADRYFLMSAFTLVGQPRLLLWVLFMLGLVQLVLRPIYSVLSLRQSLGDWPWNDARKHRLGE